MIYRTKPRKLRDRLVRLMGWMALALVLVSVLPVLILRWIDPPTSSFILQRELRERLSGGAAPRVHQRWVPWEEIAPYLPRAVVAAEDQRFPVHWGFDLVEIKNALDERQSKGRMRGASTISQQVAKNLFLWSGRSWIRKGLEVYFTMLIELTWSKRRILEVYVNIAQFGDKIFGVGAASEHFFRKRPKSLTLHDASLLAAVLPNPVRLRADAPSAHVRARAAWIRKQVRQLGSHYLEEL